MEPINCPHCGSRSFVRRSFDGFGCVSGYSVVCENQKCPASSVPIFPHARTKDKAVLRWNERRPLVVYVCIGSVESGECGLFDIFTTRERALNELEKFGVNLDTMEKAESGKIVRFNLFEWTVSP